MDVLCGFKSRFGTGGVPGVVAAPLFTDAPLEAGL
jgi:hypothetical protein